MKDSLNNPAPIAPTDTEALKSGVPVKNASGAPSANTKMVKKQGAQSGDPAAQPVAHRVNVMGRHGAAYGIRAQMGGGSDPSAGMTQANGRLFTSTINRTAPNFKAGYTQLD